MFKKACTYSETLCRYMSRFDFLPPLAMRLYLVPILWPAGTGKLFNLHQTAAWFGNPDWGLGLPFPHFFVYLVGGVEVVGAVLLLLGLGVRFISVPLMFVMFGAALTVHCQHGWSAIADHTSDATQRLHEIMTWLQSNYPQRYNYLTELGRPVMLNNGVEYAITYLIMLLSLFFTGAGRYFSLDYWIRKATSQ